MNRFNWNDEYWNTPEMQKSMERVKKDMEEWHKLSREERYKIAMKTAPRKLIIVKRGTNED